MRWDGAHRWVPRVSTLTKFCRSCRLEAPLAPDGVRRAERIRRLAARDGWRCFYCAVPLVPDAQIGAMGRRGIEATLATIEHRTPRCLGGTNAQANLVLACAWCNGNKGDRPEEQFRCLPALAKRRLAVARRYGWPDDVALALLDYVERFGLRIG